MAISSSPRSEASRCLEQGLLQTELMTKLIRIAELFPQWIPEMPAVLIHGFSDEFYDSYRADSALAEDREQRIQLYNLCQLLHHLLLFGGSYLASVANIFERYGRQVR